MVEIKSHWIYKIISYIYIYTHMLHMSILFLCLLSRILLYGFTTICLSIDVHFSCLQFLATINAANRNIHVQVFVWIYILISLEQIFRAICVCVCLYIYTHTNTHIFLRETCHFCPFLTPSYIPPYSQREKCQIFSKLCFSFF